MNQKLAKALRKYVRLNLHESTPRVAYQRRAYGSPISVSQGTVRAAYLRLKKLPPALLRTVV